VFDQSIQAAAAAPEPGESPSEPPAPEGCLELLLDETGQAFMTGWPVAMVKDGLESSPAEVSTSLVRRPK